MGRKGRKESAWAGERKGRDRSKWAEQKGQRKRTEGRIEGTLSTKKMG